MNKIIVQPTFFTGNSKIVTQKSLIFKTLVDIAIEMNNEPDIKGCVITKIPFGKSCLLSQGFGDYADLKKHPYSTFLQFAVYLGYSTEKVTRVLRDELMSSRENRNEEKGKYAGGMNLQKIVDTCIERGDKKIGRGIAKNFHIYACSAFQEPYDECVTLIGGVIDCSFEQNPKRSINGHFSWSKNVMDSMVLGTSPNITPTPALYEKMFFKLQDKIFGA